MYTIVFYISYFPSHLNPSFKLAKALTLKGYRVLYFNFPHLKNLITSQGFGFVPFPSDHYPAYVPANKSFISVNLHKYDNIKYYTKEFKKGNFFDGMLKEVCPDLIIVDLSLIYYSVFLLKKNIPFIVTCTKLCLNKSNWTPPFTSDFIPKSLDWKTKIYIDLLWKIRISKNSINNWILNLKPTSVSHFHLAKSFLTRNHFNVDEIMDTHRSSHFGLRNVPELILSPRDFDFPRKFAPNQMHIGPVVDLERKEVGYDSGFDDVWDRIEKEGADNKKCIVYCALGSCTVEFIKSRISFYIKVINVFAKKKDAILILSTGNNINPLAFKYNADNVFIFQNVPQLKILKRASLMINHGGMQSVTECIMLEVPMLVYPLQHERFDQTGNSARVEFHKMGLKGDINKDSEATIYKKVNEMLTMPSFRTNIINMKKKLINSNDFENGMRFIETYIKNIKKTRELIPE